MVIACWAVKGGVGTTVTAVATACAVGTPERPALVVDLASDVPACLGVPEPAGPGVAEWLDAGAATPPDALARLETQVRPGLWMLHRGAGPLSSARVGLLLQLLASSGRAVVIDCGRVDHDEAARVVATQAEKSVLVTRLCMMAAHRAVAAPVRPSGVVVVREPGRALAADAVADAIGTPLLAEIAADPALARAVDAGLAVARLPKRVSAVLAEVAA